MVTGKLRRLEGVEPSAEILSACFFYQGAKDLRLTFEVERRLAGGFSRGRGVRTVSSNGRVGRLASQLEAFAGRLSPAPKS
jgi:hypothetical protein